MSIDGPHDNVLVMKPPMCFSQADAAARQSPKLELEKSHRTKSGTSFSYHCIFVAIDNICRTRDRCTLYKT